MKLLTYLDTGIFHANILFVNNYDYDFVIKHLNKTKAKGWAKAIQYDKDLINNAHAVAMGRVDNGVHYYYLFINFDFKFIDENYCILAHEVVHLCQFILPRFLERDREIEAEAYLHTHIMRQCLKNLRK